MDMYGQNMDISEDKHLKAQRTNLSTKFYNKDVNNCNNNKILNHFV